MKLYANKKAESSINFLSYLLHVFNSLFSVYKQIGNGIFNDLFQEELMIHFIKFRPIKPRSPHLNGKVERSQLTDKYEFYKLIPKKDRNIVSLSPMLLDWQEFYNHKRPHASLNGKTPYEKLLELEHLIPI